jgi:hypothetical protein
MVSHHDGAHHHHEQSGRAEKQADHSERISIGHLGLRSSQFEQVALVGRRYRQVNAAKAWRFRSERAVTAITPNRDRIPN